MIHKKQSDKLAKYNHDGPYPKDVLIIDIYFIVDVYNLDKE